MTYNILIVEPGFESARELVAKSLNKFKATKQIDGRFFATWGTDFYGPKWIRPHVDGVFTFSYKQNDLVGCIRHFEATNDLKFDGILTWLDMAVPITNEAARQLNLPLITELNGNQIKNKGVVRHLLSSAPDMPPFWYKVVRNETELAAVVSAGIKFPIIAKPTEMMASLAVVKLNSLSELYEWFPKILTADFAGEELRDKMDTIEQAVILEEFVDGAEYSAEACTIAGETVILGITKKFTTEGLYWDELGHEFPAQDLSAYEIQMVQKFIFQIHNSLKIQNSITHTEFRMQPSLPDRKPVLIEINSRLCGDYIYHLFENALNVNVGHLLVATALGKKSMLPFVDTPNSSWGVRFCTTTSEGRLDIHANEPSEKYAGLDSLKKIEFYENGSFIFKPDNMYGVRLAAHIGKVQQLANSESNSLFQYNLESPIHKDILNGNIVASFSASQKDIQSMAEIEIETWSEIHAASLETIQNRYAAYPKGLIVCYNTSTGKLLGFVTLVKLAVHELAATNCWEAVANKALVPFEERNPGVTTPFHLFGLSMTVSPSAPPGVGKFLMLSGEKFAKAALAQSLEYVVRVPGLNIWVQSTGRQPQEYYTELKLGRQTEPMVEIAKHGKASWGNLIGNYFGDQDPLDFGIKFHHFFNYEVASEST